MLWTAPHPASKCHDVRVPAKSTIHAVLHRHGLIKPIGRARSSPLAPGVRVARCWGGLPVQPAFIPAKETKNDCRFPAEAERVSGWLPVPEGPVGQSRRPPSGLPQPGNAPRREAADLSLKEGSLVWEIF